MSKPVALTMPEWMRRVEQRVVRLERRGVPLVPSWNVLTLAASYTTTSGWAPLGYRLLEGGTVVELSSTRLSCSVAMTAGTDYSIVAAGGLPTEARPTSGTRHGALVLYVTTTPAFGRIAIGADGSITVRPAASATYTVIDIPMCRFYLPSA